MGDDETMGELYERLPPNEWVPLFGGAYVMRVELPPAFTCPRCERASRHPEDVKHGYCGACHDFTGTPPPGSDSDSSA